MLVTAARCASMPSPERPWRAVIAAAEFGTGRVAAEAAHPE